MHIHIIPLRFQLTDPIRSFASEKLAHLDAITDSISSAQVTLSRDNAAEPSRRFTAKVRLAVPGKDVHASESSEDLYSALDQVQSKLARQLRKRKTRLTDAVLRHGQRARKRADWNGLLAA